MPAARDQALCPEAATGPGRPSAADASGWIEGSRVEADARVGAGRLRQDDAARRVAGVRAGPPDRSRAWLSLDPATTSPSSFWAHVIAALRTVAPGVGARRSPLLESPGRRRSRPSSRPCSTSSARCPTTSCWCSTTTTRSTRREIQDGHGVPARPPAAERAPRDRHPRRSGAAAGPPARRAASSSRSAPPTCGSRPDEAAALPQRTSMGLGLTARRCRGAGGPDRRLDRRAPARRRCRCRGETTSPGFIAGFAGDDRYIVDYLVEEVLQRQPEAVRSFLLETSILAG